MSLSPTTSTRPGARGRVDDRALRRLVYRLLLVLWFTLPVEGVVRLGGEATISRGVGVVLALLAAGAVLRTGRQVRSGDVVTLVLVLAGWVALSYVWTVDPQASQQRIVTMAQLAVMVLITWEFAHTRRRVEGLMAAWIAGCLVIVGFILAAWLTGAGQNRYTAPGTHPGDQAYSMLLAIPMAWYLSLRTTRPMLVAAYRLFVPLACFATLLTGSRAALLSMGVALLIVPLCASRLGTKSRFAVGAGITGSLTAIAVLASAASGPFARLATTSTELTSGTLDNRTLIWGRALQLIEEHPVLGLGTGTSKQAIGSTFFREAGVHNTFLSIGVELGLVGLAIFLVLGLAAVYPALTRLPWLETRTAWVLTATFVLSLVPRGDEYNKSTYAILTLLALFGVVMRRRARPPGTQSRTRAGTRVSSPADDAAVATTPPPRAAAAGRDDG